MASRRFYDGLAGWAGMASGGSSLLRTEDRGTHGGCPERICLGIVRRPLLRKIVESTLASVDGVFGDPQMRATEYFDQEAENYALELVSAADAMLLGRRTCEFFRAAFPHRTGD
jgi:hypothetical protein